MADDRIEELKTLLPQCLLPDWVRLGRRLARVLRDSHHPDQRDALLHRLLQQARASVALRVERGQHVPPVTYPPELPITSRKDEIVAAIRANQVVVIAGETGSGKTTQIPKMCLEAGLGIEARIGCTQPRRVAALSISRRIAEELNVTWGREVGCKIRFDDRSSPHTYIKLMTDGILLAETQGDPDLAEYNAIIIDEAHERSLNIDFLLGHLKGLLARRADLKLIVTSATIDTQAFSQHFGGAPIIEVSGRLYPVEVQYQPLDAGLEERGEISFIDAAVQAAERIVYESDSGDALIFMPGERDIRETSDQLAGRVGSDAEIIPLFGRLSAGDQQRVFQPSARRKIVIATNIAETSLTIPGIRYVIDAGLARISRYNPRTRIKRLPVEPVSQSSANQRKGRAGRVRDGICIRLYAEDDFNARPLFTQPEIQRANLAEVILRMKAFHLGDIETFPFVQPPAPAAIANGYTLLQELGALDAQRALTPLGEDLARLPIDPTLGRMLLQSQREHATAEMLIIAAGLSIQDPRDRPMDQKEAAAAAHRQFSNPTSDFLSLLNIWRAVHDQWDALRTQNGRRRFCRQRFLSYIRMREWQDVYAQLHDALDDLGTLKLNESNAAYEAIHRSILAGLIGHVARFEERNTYKMAGNRPVAVFPGSALHARGEPNKKTKANQPQWIVAGEIVETSQLFARTLGGIDPQWIYQLAPHCCKVAHRNPHWVTNAGNVLVDEIVTLHGLEVQRKKVDYGNVNKKEATEIFIRAALIEEQLLPDSNWPEQYRFLTHNRNVRDKIENWRTRVRQHTFANPDDALADFYERHLPEVSSLHDLNRALRDPTLADRLCITEAELAGGQSLAYDPSAFPDSITVGGQTVALAYAYAPGEEHDGVTIQLPFTVAQSASAPMLEWAVPGLREDMIAELLRALPKSIRRELMPFPPKIAEIVAEFQPAGKSFLEDLAAFLRRRYGIAVREADWTADALAAHLRPRIAIVDHERKSLAAGRDFVQLQNRVQQLSRETKAPLATGEWTRAAQKWERFGVTDWTFGDLPERITISEQSALPVYAWPGLELIDDSVNLRLFHSIDQMRAATQGGLTRLIELALQKDLAWLEKDLRGLTRVDALHAPIGGPAELRETAFDLLKRYVLKNEMPPALSRAHFDSLLAVSKARLPALATQFMDKLTLVLQARQQAHQRIGSTAVTPAKPRALNSFSQIDLSKPVAAAHPLSDELNHLAGPRFLERIEYDRLPHLHRYLKGLAVRAERAGTNPAKNQERLRQLLPYAEAWQKLRGTSVKSNNVRREVENFRWMVEEFKISLFAQELGTALPVSAKRLDQQLELIRQTI